VTGGYFYYGPDNFLTSRSYPAGYVCAVGGYLCEGDSFVRDTGRRNFTFMHHTFLVAMYYIEKYG